MLQSSVPVDHITLLSLLPSLPSLTVPAIHAVAVHLGLYLIPAVANCFISAYSRAGPSGAPLSRKVFDEIPAGSRDIISWNAMVTAYAQNGFASEVLALYDKMVRLSVIRPDAVTFVGVLSACAHLGARSFGRRVEQHIASVTRNVHLCNALINFHARCGALSRARELFDGMASRTVVSWTALIAGYGLQGNGATAVELFERMTAEGFHPDKVAMVSVLSACSHAGMTECGMAYFDNMEVQYGIKRTAEHYACIVDLLGRAGHLERAVEVIKSMPAAGVVADGAVWGALLGACKIHKNAEVGERAFQEVMRLEPENVGYHVLMANIYRDNGMVEGASQVRKGMRRMGLRKEPGCSYVEIRGRVYAFVADDRRHPEAEKIHAEVAAMEVAVGVGRTAAGGVHSERLAVAFAVMKSGGEEREIVVIKNLRVCEECHVFLKLVSGMTEGRVLLVRDATRFHRFEGGCCSCNDYW